MGTVCTLSGAAAVGVGQPFPLRQGENHPFVPGSFLSASLCSSSAPEVGGGSDSTPQTDLGGGASSGLGWFRWSCVGGVPEC